MKPSLRLEIEEPEAILVPAEQQDLNIYWVGCTRKDYSELYEEEYPCCGGNVVINPKVGQELICGLCGLPMEITEIVPDNPLEDIPDSFYLISKEAGETFKGFYHLHEDANISRTLEVMRKNAKKTD